MKLYVHSDRDYATYNYAQTEVGSPLRTLKGSMIKRCPKYGVGKEIGGDIYVHRNYMEKVVPAEVLEAATTILKEEQPEFYFHFNTIKYNPRTDAITFFSCPGFDSEREPVVGDYITITDTGNVKYGHSSYIYHSKWLWVENDYTGFDVAESWEWSKQWLSVLTETADGNGIGRWNAQLQRFGLPLDN